MNDNQTLQFLREILKALKARNCDAKCVKAGFLPESWMSENETNRVLTEIAEELRKI